jgi:hypothetical protein
MHTIEVPETKFKRYIPADLSECDSQQYIDMCELIFHFQNEAISYDELRIHAVYKLMNMKPSKAKNLERDIDVPLTDHEEKFSNVYLISELIDSFFEQTEQGRTIKQYYIHNPVPIFRPVWKRLYGPSDSFMNMTFGEYTDAIRLFHDFHATGDMEILKLITALFYRPKKPFLFIKKQFHDYNGDVREPYNSHNLEARAKTLNNAPIGFVYGFYLLFASFQKYLIDAKILWSGKEIDFSILFESSAGSQEPDSTETPGIGMDAIAFSIAESGAFGTIEEVRKANFWQIMVRMYDLRRTDLERQKQEKNATNK